MSDAQFLIEKKEEETRTLTCVYRLDEKGKTQELVRLLGGGEKDEFAVKHAEELLKQAVEFKKSV